MARPNVTAFIYDKHGKLLSVGRNSYVKTHPLQAASAIAVGEPQRIFLHAEIHAITRLEDYEKPHKIQVFRYNSEGQAVLAKPCRVCQYAINKVGIKEVYHT